MRIWYSLTTNQKFQRTAYLYHSWRDNIFTYHVCELVTPWCAVYKDPLPLLWGAEFSVCNIDQGNNISESEIVPTPSDMASPEGVHNAKHDDLPGANTARVRAVQNAFGQLPIGWLWFRCSHCLSGEKKNAPVAMIWTDMEAENANRARPQGPWAHKWLPIDPRIRKQEVASIRCEFAKKCFLQIKSDGRLCFCRKNECAAERSQRSQGSCGVGGEITNAAAAHPAVPKSQSTHVRINKRSRPTKVVQSSIVVTSHLKVSVPNLKLVNATSHWRAWSQISSLRSAQLCDRRVVFS